MLVRQIWQQWERSFFLPVLTLFISLSMLATAADVTAADEKAPKKLVANDQRDPVTLFPVVTPLSTDTELVQEIKDGLTKPEHAACRATLKNKLEKYEKELADLQKFASSTPTPTPNQIRKAEWDLKKTHEQYLAQVRLCGPCRTRAVASWSGKTGTWHGTDGSCWLNTTDAKIIADGFTASTKSLRTRADYLKFPHIVKVATVQADGKDFDTSAALLSDNFLAFLAIRTPLESEKSVQTFYYYIENEIPKEDTAQQNFSIVFSSYREEKNGGGIKQILPSDTLRQKFLGKEKDPATGKEITSYYTTPGGRKLAIGLMIPMGYVKGQWHLTGTTLRYSTYGLFMLGGGAVQKHANDVLLEALLEMYRRATGGKIL